MEINVYEPPKSDLSATARIEVPAEISKKIKGGWVAALISGVLTIGIMAIALSTNTMANLFNIWTSLDVILAFALAYGIYKKSRAAATIMFLYFLASKVLIIVETGSANGLLLGAIFLYFYFQAMVGTFQYHQLLKEASR